MPGVSVAYQLIPRPDWAATTTVAVADGSVRDARAWADAVFAVGSVPLWVKALFGAREAVAKLLRIPPGRPGVFAVREVRDGEALIDNDDRHLRFVAGVRADEHLLHVTTVVQLKAGAGSCTSCPSGSCTTRSPGR